PLGLLGIRERARLLGGQATVTQVPRGGFCLTVQFPAKRDSAAEALQWSA
ncbi:histidine kinase, partial [Ralstonia solanacearum]